MTALKDVLPNESETVKAIYAHYKKVGDSESTRGYLGASSIGHYCERYLWYQFRYCCKPNFSGRMYRLFETGNLEEARFVKNLRAIGCEVHDTDERRLMERTPQFKVTAFGGHLKGYMDGCALGIPEAPKTWHVLEFKTHSAKSFRRLKKEGVMYSKPQHYAQVQIEMHLTGMKRALYLARNKDTDDLYSERIRYDKTEAEALMEKAERIITAQSPPDRISVRPDFYQCNWCDARGICWGKDSKPALPVPVLSCRQCCHATPLMDGKDRNWCCRKLELPIDGDTPCKDHLTLPGLLEAFAEPGNYGGNDINQEWIVFHNSDGTTWKHGNAEGCFSSEELTKLPASALGNKTIQKAKDLLGATVGEDILSRYPKEDSRIIWEGNAEKLERAWKAAYNSNLTELKPIAQTLTPECDAAELEGGRVVIVWKETGTAEIREGKE
ncbi:hypothetical protein LCGC14_2179660 [marine sediment metagenome]|uniref:PD-(D/E)XK endonuclease-like domain-containing protein n=1 Tax=marine sediment metagenome TaxID=412755 RepID=A0A0F9DMN5_9ZZZZ